MIKKQRKANMVIARCDKYYERKKKALGLEAEGIALGRAIRGRCLGWWGPES